MRRHLWCAVLATALLCITAGQVSAQGRIRSSGVRPFVYDGRAYVPVRSTCDYVGAAFTWDPYAKSATVVYHNRNLTLVVGSASGYYNDEPVALGGPVIVVQDQLYGPASAFDRYLGVPMRWEPRRHRASFQGPPGWGYYDVDPYTPPYALGIVAGYGYVPSYAPAPFIYGGATYLPLRSVADVIGAVLLLDLLSDRAVVTYGGVQTVLYIGSPRAYYGGRVVVLSGAPIICNNIVYVPERLVEDHWRVPVRREQGRLEVQGTRGWHDFNIRQAPPARIYRSMTAAPLLRTAASGLRSAGMTRPIDPGFVSRPGKAHAGAPSGRASRGVMTGFPALAATRPHGGAVTAPRAASGKTQGHVAVAPRGMSPKVQGHVAAAPRRVSPRVQGHVAAAPRRVSPKIQGHVAAAPRRVSPRVQGHVSAAPRQASPRVRGHVAAAPRQASPRAQGHTSAAPRRSSGKAQGGAPQDKGGSSRSKRGQGHGGG
jgi:hypothetical protein